MLASSVLGFLCRTLCVVGLSIGLDHDMGASSLRLRLRRLVERYLKRACRRRDRDPLLSRHFRLLLASCHRAHAMRVNKKQLPPAFEPWTRHPLALLGDWRQYRPAAAELRVVPSPPSAPWTLHEVHSYTDADEADALNFGWNASCHVFLLRPELDLVRLRSAALAQAEEGAGLIVSNRGGYHSQLSWLDELAVAADARDAAAAAQTRAAIGAAIAAASDCESGGGASGGTTWQPSHSWVNVAREGHYHGLHDHEGSCWSGVLYLGVPPGCTGASGALALRTASSAPGSAASWCSYAAMTPVEAALLVFPAWLPHAVLPLKGVGGTRISLSFNSGIASAPPGDA